MAKGKYEKWLTEEGLLKISAWARDGLSNEDIAHNMGISRKTLNEWVKKHELIRNALKESKDVADIRVENALFKKTQGYNVKVLKHVKLKEIEIDPETGRKTSEKEILKEVFDEVHIPADVTAQSFWLSHRKPNEWGAVQGGGEDEGNGVIEIPMQTSEE